MVQPVQLQKAFLTTESGQKIECMFNPERFAFSMSNRWEPSRVPGRSAPGLRFAGGESGAFTLSLTFDTTAEGVSVTTHTNKLLKLMDVDESLPSFDAARNSGRPQWVTFHWGTDIHTFTAIIKSLNVAFTYFSNEGLPLRAARAPAHRAERLVVLLDEHLGGAGQSRGRVCAGSDIVRR